MAESKVISIRIPTGHLNDIDHLAAKRYPQRRGGYPNRSQLILDLIETGIENATEPSANICMTKSTEALEAMVGERIAPVQEKLAVLESALGEFAA